MGQLPLMPVDPSAEGRWAWDLSQLGIVIRSFEYSSLTKLNVTELLQIEPKMIHVQLTVVTH